MATTDAILTIRRQLRAWSDKALARLGLAVNATEAVRTAHVLAHQSADADPEVVLEYAVQLQVAAARILEQAVVAARGENCTWERIGEALGMSRQGAQERFKAAEAAWKDALIEPVVPDDRTITTMKEPLVEFSDPAVDAERVDAALRRITPMLEPTLTDDRPFAARLPQHDAAARAVEVLWRANEITRRRGVDGEAPDDMIEDYQERKAAAEAAATTGDN